MITITTQQAMDFMNSIDDLSDYEMPLKGAYKINKIKKEVASIAEMFQEKFNAVIDEYAERDENGNVIYTDDEQTQVRIIEGKMSECNAKLETLLKEEVEINNQNLRIDDLGEEFECTPRELEALDPFFSE